MHPRENPQSVDWTDQLDDYDSEFWDDYLGGPDDHLLEPDYAHVEPDYAYAEEEPAPDPSELQAEDAYWEQQDLGRTEEPSPPVGADSSAPPQEPAPAPDTRREAIVQWLAESRVSRPLRSGDGFYVLRGKYGRLTDGAVVEMLDWLGEEGIVGGTLVGGYSVSYTPPGGPYLEKLTFFRIVERVPFSRRASSQQAAADPDLPF